MITFSPSHTITVATLTRVGSALVEDTAAAHTAAMTLAETATAVYQADPSADTAGTMEQAVHHLCAVRAARLFIRETVLPLVMDYSALAAPTQGNLYHAQRMLEKGRDTLLMATRATW